MAQRFDVREVEVHPRAPDKSPRTFELGDDETILDSEMRHGNTLLLWIATPTTADRCMATTSDGSRCQRDAVEGSNYCPISSHGSDDE